MKIDGSKARKGFVILSKVILFFVQVQRGLSGLELYLSCTEQPNSSSQLFTGENRNKEEMLHLSAQLRNRHMRLTLSEVGQNLSRVDSFPNATIFQARIDHPEF